MWAAVAFGTKYLHEGNRQVAEYLLNQAMASEAIHPVMRQVAIDQLDVLSGDANREVVDR